MEPLTAQDPLAHSTDSVADNLLRLRELFPEAFTEGRVDMAVLRQLLGENVDERDEKYGLNWHGKRQARQLALTPSTGTLRPAPADGLGNWDTTGNMLIEGDNLEVLKLLQKSYAGQVKLIYIDPPYNTGKDFVYPDNFKNPLGNYLELTGQVKDGEKMSSNTEASGRFHTDWLNMMYPRLKLARNLMRQDGVILISIDEAEITNLHQLCNDIFGEENLVANLVWEKGRKNDAKFFSIGHEYILIYAKSITYLREIKTIWREEKPGAREIWEKYLELRKQHGKDDKSIEIDIQQWYSELPKSHPSKKWSRYKRIDINGPWRDRDISWPGGGGPRYDVEHPITKQACKVPERGWIYSSPDEMQRQIKLGLVEFRDDHTEPPFRKAHIRPIPAELLEESGEEESEITDSESDEEFATQVRGSYFYKQSQVAIRHFRSLMEGKVFSNPKDHVELAKLFAYTTSNDSEAIVLDFFAGSGTTGHAVMEMNVADGGNRRYILVQLPEPLDPTKKEQKAAAKYCDTLGKPRTIAELTKERLRRAARKVQAENSLFSGDLGFRVYKLDTSNIAAWRPRPDDVRQSLFDYEENIKPSRTDADLLTELLLKLGLPLTTPIEQRELPGGHLAHSLGAGTLLVCLSAHLGAADYEVVGQALVTWHHELRPAGDTQVLFRDSAFDSDVTKTNLAALLRQHIERVQVRSL